MAMLEVHNIHTFYGKIHALKGISIEVEEGKVVTLIGSNGAGKSTTLNTISGVTPASEGKIIFRGEDITAKPPHEIVKLGISQSPEGRKIFKRLSVRDNLEMGAYTRSGAQVSDQIMHDLEYVFETFPRLKEREHQAGGTLSGGEQQMLAIGRALMARPKILLLDEPSMGLAPLLVLDIFKVIEYLNSQGTTILLVEQNAQMALQVAHHAYVLQTGRIIMAGDADVLAQDESVRDAYLGGH